MAAVPEAVRRSLEQLIMKGYEYQSEFMRRYHEMALATGRAEGEAIGRAKGEAIGRAKGEAIGRAKGEATGRAEGQATGRAEGQAKGEAIGHTAGLQDAVLELAHAKLEDLSPDEIAAIRTLGDEPTLRALIGALARTTTAAQARGALHAAATVR